MILKLNWAKYKLFVQLDFIKKICFGLHFYVPIHLEKKTKPEKLIT